MVKHIRTSFVGAAGVIATIALTEMEPPTSLLWFTAGVFLLAAALMEFTAGRPRDYALLVVALVYTSIALPTMLAVQEPIEDAAPAASAPNQPSVGPVSALTTVGVVTTEPVPGLVDRYMESWFPGESGALVIVEGAHLPTVVGKRQMFTPAVRAPESTGLTNVTLSICVPTHFKWDQNREWVLQEIGQCGPQHARYTTHFDQIARGAGLNPRDAFWFLPTEPGEHLVKYSITSAELSPFESFFFVDVARL